MNGLKIRGIEFDYNNLNELDGASIRFDTHNVQGETMSINGFVRVSLAEYNANSGNLESLGALVLLKVKNKLNEEK